MTSKAITYKNLTVSPLAGADTLDEGYKDILCIPEAVVKFLDILARELGLTAEGIEKISGTAYGGRAEDICEIRFPDQDGRDQWGGGLDIDIKGATGYGYLYELEIWLKDGVQPLDVFTAGPALKAFVDLRRAANGHGPDYPGSLYVEHDAKVNSTAWTASLF